MEGEVAEFKNPPDSTKCDLLEAKTDQLKESTVSTERAKSGNNGKRWDPLRSMLNILLLNFLIVAPLCSYVVYVTDGFFSRGFADLVLLTFYGLLGCSALSKMIGSNNENYLKKWKILGVNINLALLLLNLTHIPLRLYQAYLIDGIFSPRFAHLARCAYILIFTHLRLSKMISSEVCVVMVLPVICVSFVVFLEWDLLFCVTVAGCLVFFIIIWYVLIMYEEGYDKKSDGEDVSLSA